MTDLYKPEAFEPLTDEPWNEASVADAIQTIVNDAEAAFDPDALWPAGEWESWQTPLPLKSMYVGASGVVWALHALRNRGRADGSLDLADAIARTHEIWRAEPDFMGGIELPTPRESALMTGETGILMTAWLIAPTRSWPTGCSSGSRRTQTTRRSR